MSTSWVLKKRWNGLAGSGPGNVRELLQNEYMPVVSTRTEESMYCAQLPLKLTSKKRCG